MSRRHSQLLRALINCILISLGLLALGSLHVVLAQQPMPATLTWPDRLPLLPPAQLLQRGLLLSQRPPAAPPAPWQAHLNPVQLLAEVQSALSPVAISAPSFQLSTPSNSPASLPYSLPTSHFPLPTSTSSPSTLAAPSLPAYPKRLSTANNPLPTSASDVIALRNAPDSLQIATHQSIVLELPDPLTRVAITDDSIAQALVVAPRQVLVQGRAPGEVTLLLWGSNARPRSYTVHVGLDPVPLQRELDRLYPHQNLTVSTSGDALVVSGVLANPGRAKQVLAVAGGFSPRVVNNLSLDAAADPGQVLLQVRFAEVDRSAVTQFGANLISTATRAVGSLGTGEFGTPGAVTTPAPGQATAGITGSGANFGLSDLLNVFLFSRGANLGLTLQALEQKNLLQILAEPNLLAMDGKDASFLAGGEFPFPVVQGQGSVNNVTIQFKPFGVNLHFKPTILPDGTIDLQVAPEVSSLDFSNALTVSGFLIPALSTRRAQTELELQDGESFVIAGLMDNRLTTNMSKLPGLGDIPILGKFFQSRNTNKSRSELVVVVTAHLVHPSAHPAHGPVMPRPFLDAGKFDHSGGSRQ